MKGTVNPFEPWRPLADRIPPPLHVGRPWRPSPPPPARAAVEEPPFVEPAKALPRNKLPERPKRPQREHAQTIPPRTPSLLTAFVVFGLGAVLSGPFVVLIFDILGGLCGAHAPRLLALSACTGLFAFMAFNHRRSWATRLTWMAVALAYAGIALWFVPTMHGVNLWSAYRQVEALRALPAGDVAAYQRGAAARRTLAEEFPSFAAEVSAAEKAWFHRTVDEVIESTDRQLTKDPDAALVRLHRLDKDLLPLDHYASVRKDLESARRRAVQACLKVAP